MLVQTRWHAACESRGMRDAFQPEDIFLYQSLGELHCSANAAACVVKTIDRAADSYRSAIWTVPFAGGAPRQFTRGDHADGSPGWSPDGTQLGFISTREGGVPQVHLIARDGGEARRLTCLEEGVASFDWSPDGRRLLVAGARSVDPDARGQGHARHKPRAVDAPELAWRLPYKSDGRHRLDPIAQLLADGRRVVFAGGSEEGDGNPQEEGM